MRDKVPYLELKVLFNKFEYKIWKLIFLWLKQFSKERETKFKI